MEANPLKHTSVRTAMMGIDYINEKEQDGDGGDIRTSVAYNHERHALILMATRRQGWTPLISYDTR